MELSERLIADAEERHRIKLAKYKNADPELSNMLWEEAVREAVAAEYCRQNAELDRLYEWEENA